jgi:hypothetical protein
VTALLEVLANTFVAAGLLIAIGAVLRGLPVSQAASAGLELWLAAGLLRLSYLSTWSAIALAAITVVLRRVAAQGLAGNTGRRS